ncbi:hypothetical protein TKK_0015474 [Trichogramma kaykai]
MTRTCKALLAEEFGSEVHQPTRFISDFGLAIVNATTVQIRHVSLCFFPLCQSVYCPVQIKGLQVQYKNPDDLSIRQASKMMCASAFVPTKDILEAFDEFMEQVLEEFMPIAEYFEVTYVRRRPATDRRTRASLRYAPTLWNQ